VTIATRLPLPPHRFSLGWFFVKPVHGVIYQQRHIGNLVGGELDCIVNTPIAEDSCLVEIVHQVRLHTSASERLDLRIESGTRSPVGLAQLLHRGSVEDGCAARGATVFRNRGLAEEGRNR
jgi:hypothetical protein